MRTLLDLLPDPAGRAYLASRGMHCDVETFLEQLQAPESPDLNTLLGLDPATRLVHIGQQVCTDYHPTTLTKFEVVADLAGRDLVATAVLWHDADRADSEKYGLRIVLPSGSKTVGIPLAARSEGAAEPRFIDVSPSAVTGALAHLERWAAGRNQDRPKAERSAAKERLDRLAAAIDGGASRSLGAFNAQLAGFLLREGLGLQVRSTFLSTMIAEGLLTASIDGYLNALDDVIAVFNEAVADLVAHDIDPQVKPLPPDHLPLHYSCPTTGRRLRLTHVRDGDQHLATAPCSCDVAHTFALGSSRLSLDEVAATGRWSPDVSLPLHHNHLASGWVVGRSTALYGLVLNEVARRVFSDRPIPGLVPPSLTAGTEQSGEHSLLVDYLTR